MSNSEHTTAHAVTPGDDSRLTVEDTGSTADASELRRDDAVRSSDDARVASTGTDDRDRAAARMQPDDDSISHVFDQTNGMIDGVDGDSDGTAQSDVLSDAERTDDGGRLDGAVPLGQDGTGTMRRDPND